MSLQNHTNFFPHLVLLYNIAKVLERIYLFGSHNFSIKQIRNLEIGHRLVRLQLSDKMTHESVALLIKIFGGQRTPSSPHIVSKKFHTNKYNCINLNLANISKSMICPLKVK